MDHSGPAWLELINASEVFGDIMIDYSYTECTSACVQSLVKYQQCYPGVRTAAINKSISRGVQFIKQKQRPDGSWYATYICIYCRNSLYHHQVVVSMIMQNLSSVG
jgi:squalene cyclase